MKNNYSISLNQRTKRFKYFSDLIKSIKLNQDNVIIDVGGTTQYWESIRSKFTIDFNPILINISKESLFHDEYNRIMGDGQCLRFIKNNAVDLLYSNSVIEHFSEYIEQKEMAINLLRVSKFHFIQTPAFLFPIEPHFLFPFYHWLPKSIRVFLLQHFNLGWYTKCNKSEARKFVNSIRILKKKELREMFPSSKIITERWMFLPKSYLIHNIYQN